MVCKLGCSFPVAFADSFEKSLDDFMAYSSVLQRGYARGRKFPIILDGRDHSFGQIRAVTARDRRRVPGGRPLQTPAY